MGLVPSILVYIFEIEGYFVYYFKTLNYVVTPKCARKLNSCGGNFNYQQMQIHQINM